MTPCPALCSVQAVYDNSESTLGKLPPHIKGKYPCHDVSCGSTAKAYHFTATFMKRAHGHMISGGALSILVKTMVTARLEDFDSKGARPLCNITTPAFP